MNPVDALLSAVISLQIFLPKKIKIFRKMMHSNMCDCFYLPLNVVIDLSISGIVRSSSAAPTAKKGKPYLGSSLTLTLMKSTISGVSVCWPPACIASYCVTFIAFCLLLVILRILDYVNRFFVIKICPLTPSNSIRLM